MKKRRARPLQILWILIWFLSSSSLFAGSDGNRYDVSTKIGGSLGSITIESQSKVAANKSKKDSYQLGGIPIYFSFNYDIFEHLTLNLGPGLLLDAPNSVILRQSFELGAVFHVLGGARRLERAGNAVSIVASSPSNVSIGLRTGLNNYGTRIEQIEFNGSAFETKIGIEYRKDNSPDSAYGSEIYATVLTMPSSVTRIRYKAIEVLAFWRLFL
jgi:hypothetical protein